MSPRKHGTAQSGIQLAPSLFFTPPVSRWFSTWPITPGAEDASYSNPETKGADNWTVRVGIAAARHAVVAGVHWYKYPGPLSSPFPLQSTSRGAIKGQIVPSTGHIEECRLYAWHADDPIVSAVITYLTYLTYLKYEPGGYSHRNRFVDPDDEYSLT